MPAAKRTPVEYLVKEKSLIGNELFEAGTNAFYDGLPAENLEPLCDEGRARYQEYLDSNKARVARMIADVQTGNGGEDAKLMQALTAIFKASQAEISSAPVKRTKD